jgi:hypothetical protein
VKNWVREKAVWRTKLGTEIQKREKDVSFVRGDCHCYIYSSIEQKHRSVRMYLESFEGNVDYD